MRGPLRVGYGALAQLARGLAAIAPESESKFLRTLRARRGIRARYREWSERGRDPSRPLLWMHAPSVGEGLQARPILELLRARRPSLQLAYSHFSPSAAEFARGLNVDFRDYLPFDTEGDARAALDALRPTALVFSKLDVWPVLTRVAKARGVRLGLISGTLAAGSSRRSRGAGALLRDAYAALDAVGAIDAEDADRLVAAGVRREACVVTGDTRYDQVWQKAGATDREHSLLRDLQSERFTIVAGSTWPADERVLCAAIEQLRQHGGASGIHLRLVIAPHEPTTEAVERLLIGARTAGMQAARLGADDALRADVVVVDRVGVLGSLYALADAAFVGGGFHSAGLHSVLEPAAFGAPVLFGPLWTNSRDARLLIEGGGAIAVNDAPALETELATWARDERARKDAGAAAREVVREGVGAAERSLRLVEGLLD